MISAKTIDKAYEFYLTQPLSSIRNESVIYNNDWVFTTGLAIIPPNPHRHYTKEEFTQKINSDKSFKNFCLPKIDLNYFRAYRPKYPPEVENDQNIIRLTYFNGEIRKFEYPIHHTTAIGTLISKCPYSISNGIKRSCLYNFIPTGKNSFSLLCFSRDKELGERIFKRKLKKVLNKMCNTNLKWLDRNRDLASELKSDALNYANELKNTISEL